MKIERECKIKSTLNIPKDGRIGRFAKILKKEVEEDMIEVKK